MPFHALKIGNTELISLLSQPEERAAIANFFPDLEPSPSKPHPLESVYRVLPETFAGDAAHMRFCGSSCAIKSSAGTVIVDACLPLAQDSWPFMESLIAAGIHPDSVTHVFITHRDGDHIGGLADRRKRDGGITFKHAQHYIGRGEWEDFQRDEARRESFERVMRPLETEGLLEVIETASLPAHATALEFLPGLKAMLTPGHRSGATSLLLEDQVLLTADVLHAPFQITHPDMSISFDADKSLAAKTRAEVVALAEQNRWLLHVPHTPPFGLGRVARGADGNAYWEAL